MAINYQHQPLVSHRFHALFFFRNLIGKNGGGRIPLPELVECGFQRIDGLGRMQHFSQFNEGGQNIRNQYLAENIEHGKVVFERGLMPRTLTSVLLNQQFFSARPIYSDVLIMALGQNNLPAANWLLINALPENWQTSELNAYSNNILVDTLTFNCQEIILLGPEL